MSERRILTTTDLDSLKEGAYELIEKVIIGYELLTSKPADWDTNWATYYRNTGASNNPVYELLTDATAPTWENNKYYSYTGESASVWRDYRNDATMRFKAMRVYYKTKGAIEIKGWSVFYCVKNGQTTIVAPWWLNSIAASTNDKYSQACVTVEKRYGRWLISLLQPSINQMNTPQEYNTSGGYNFFNDDTQGREYINKVDINGVISAGTEVEIWGVRI